MTLFPAHLPPSPILRRSTRCESGGFTLIELLTVIAIIGVLSAISVGFVTAINKHNLQVRAQTHLVLISLALDQFKGQYGDYPRTADPRQLFDALTGKLGPKCDAALNPRGKAFLADLEKLKLLDPSPAGLSPTAALGSNEIWDPWDQPYRYAYKPPTSSAATTWTNPSYVLYSIGPPRSDAGLANDPSSSPTLDSNGYLNKDDPKNFDNIYP